MKLVLPFDTETTGMPNWKIPSDDSTQPHLVQLAAVLCNADTRQKLQSIDLIIKPDGWVIPEEMVAIHGITTEMANDVGVSERLAVEMLIDLCGDADRIAFNKTFDQRIIRIALKRYKFGDEAMEKWAQKDNFHCSMRMVQKVHGGKVMTLTDAYNLVTGMTLENAHSAMADTLAARDIYFDIKPAFDKKISEG
jgi:DNA polymerase-3 subunit epsilon